MLWIYLCAYAHTHTKKEKEKEEEEGEEEGRKTREEEEEEEEKRQLALNTSERTPGFKHAGIYFCSKTWILTERDAHKLNSAMSLRWCLPISELWLMEVLQNELQK